MNISECPICKMRPKPWPVSQYFAGCSCLFGSDGTFFGLAEHWEREVQAYKAKPYKKYEEGLDILGPEYARFTKADLLTTKSMLLPPQMQSSINILTRETTASAQELLLIEIEGDKPIDSLEISGRWRKRINNLVNSVECESLDEIESVTLFHIINFNLDIWDNLRMNGFHASPRNHDYLYSYTNAQIVKDCERLGEVPARIFIASEDALKRRAEARANSMLVFTSKSGGGNNG